MGNNVSTANEHQQSGPNGAGDVTRGLSNSRERDQKGESRNPSAARYVATQSPPQQRIVVDIRSANLDKDYNVYIRQEPRRELDVELRSIWNGVQAIGGLLITFLTIQKLWEDIRFIRLLRGELSTIVGSLTDASSGPEVGLGDDAGIRPLRPRNGGRRSPSRRSLDLSLDQLSELLGGARGEAQQAAAAATEQVGSEAAKGQPPQEAGDDMSLADHKATTWGSISGLTEVKILLQEATVLPTLRPDLFQGIRQPPKALLLFGPPGTGKTLLARAVAAESRATFLPITGSSVLSMWYGQSEQNVKALFEKARRRQPAIIFIDEVDSLLGKRSSGGLHDSSSTPDKRVTNEFLAFIDGIQTQQAGGASSGSSSGGAAGDTRITIIAATNTPWDLDEAALSRFSRRIYVPLPDKTTRETLMRKAMEGVTCDISKEEWQRLAERCDKYSGRDLVQVCREAAMRPLRELWGRRLLEGGTSCPGAACSPAPHHAAAQKRLVELVADSLAAAAAVDARRAGGEGQGAAEASGAGTAAAAGPGRRRGIGPWRWRWGALGSDRYAWSKKQARRELEKWKRRHGASWFDVEAVMTQAERLADSRRRPGRAAAAEAEGAAEGAVEGAAEAGAEGVQVNGTTGDPEQQQSDTAQPHQATQDAEGAPEQEQTHEEGARMVRSGGMAPQPAGLAQPPGDIGIADDADGGGGPQVHTTSPGLGSTQPLSDAAFPTDTTPSSSTGAIDVTVTSAPADSDDAVRPLEPSPAVAPAAAVGPNARSPAVESVASDLVLAAAQSSDIATKLTAPDGVVSVAVTAAAADTAKEASTSLDASSTPSEGPSSNPMPTGDSASDDPARIATAVKPPAATCTSTSTHAAATDDRSQAPAATAAAGSAAPVTSTSTAASGSALSLADLLTLPASRVRPVVAADLEAALQVISCTEMDQSARYTEWDEQYGSGAVAKGCHSGGRGSRWMSMYV